MTAPTRSLALPRHAPAMLTAIVGSLVYLVWRPPTADLSNQYFRAWVFGEAPLSPWDNRWFGGHHTFGYSVLAQPLGWLLGPTLLGVAAVLAAAWVASVLCHRIVERTPGLRWPDLAACVVTIGCMTSLYGGRIAFLLGTTFGLVAVLAAVADRPVSTAIAGALGALSSPVVALFLVMLGGAMWLGRSARLRVGVALAVPALVLVGALSLLFPDPGDFPLLWGGLVNVLLVTAAAAAAGWRHATVRWASLANAALCLLVAVVATPVGGNAVRLAAIAAPVVLVMCPLGSRWLTAALVTVPVVALQVAPLTLAVRGESDQMEAEFYEPLIDVLAARPGPLRVEVVPVATHEEARFVGEHVALARGWNRQLDRHHHEVLYETPLTAEGYLAWLQDNGVSVVAIADTTLDDGGEREAALLEDPPAYLRQIYADDVWRVYEVTPAPSLVGEGAELTDLSLDSFTLRVDAPGDVPVKVRFSPWMAVSSGDACVEEGDDGWAVVRAPVAGTVTVTAALSFSRFFDRDGDC